MGDRRRAGSQLTGGVQTAVSFVLLDRLVASLQTPHAARIVLARMLPIMKPLDIILLVVAGYMAVMALVKIMVLRREKRLTDLRNELELERRRKLLEQRHEQKGRPAA